MLETTGVVPTQLLSNSIKSLFLATQEMDRLAASDTYASGVADGRYQPLCELATVVGYDLPELPPTLATNDRP